MRRKFLVPLIASMLFGTSNCISAVRAEEAAKTPILDAAAKVAATESVQSPFDLRVTPDYCQKILSKVDQLISKNLYSADIAKNEWMKARAEFGKKIVESKTIMDLDQWLNAAIKKMHVSHCQFVTTNDETFYFLNALFSRFNNKPKGKMDFTGVICGGNGLPFNQVRYIIDGSPGEQSKFVVGDKIITVSGEPYVGQANFFKTSGKKIPIVVERDGKGVTLTVTPNFKDPFLAYIEGTTRSARIFDSPEGKVGYVHLWAGGQEPRDAFETLLSSKLAETDGLIIDMRDGYGGNSLTDLDFFYRNPIGYPLFTMQERGGHKSGTKEYYNKPVVALINGGSRSGKELLAYSLKKSGRARLIGDRTAGYVLGGRLFPIDERCALYLAVTDCEVDGVRLEGIGVEPDVLIPNPDYKLDVAQKQFDKAKELLLPLLKKPLPALNGSK
ncbi:MAG: hypothetical protein JST89_05860 [Cyanobacteria bacterium SZAS-4]|nr:hypothetical protein [Cyanobacteria bacterium SZAS-4]